MGGQFGDLERGMELVLRQARPPAALLVLLDADEDDLLTLRSDLLRRVQACRRDVPSAVVLARREYEAWFLAAAESLRGQRGLPANLAAPADPKPCRTPRGGCQPHAEEPQVPVRRPTNPP